MGYEVLGQEQVFWYACVLGAVLGIMYDIFRIVRLAIKWNKWYIFIQDILYFVISGVATFLFLLSFNNGVVRIYVLCGELMGWIAYYITLGELVYRFSGNIIKIIKGILKKIFLFVFNPFVAVLKKFKSILYNKRIKSNKT